jgi:hypothetical protein
MEEQGEQMCSFDSFKTSTLNRVSDERQAHSRFTPEEGLPVPIRQEAVWVPVAVCTQRLEENPLSSSGDRTLFIRLYSP